MQSLASLMSMKPSDVGNLDDFAESDEEEANGPGAPEARARVSQPGGLTAVDGDHPPPPGGWGMARAKIQLLCWGRASLCTPSAWSSLLPGRPILIVQNGPVGPWRPGAVAYTMGSQCLPASLALSSPRVCACPGLFPPGHSSAGSRGAAVQACPHHHPAWSLLFAC